MTAESPKPAVIKPAPGIEPTRTVVDYHVQAILRIPGHLIPITEPSELQYRLVAAHGGLEFPSPRGRRAPRPIHCAKGGRRKGLFQHVASIGHGSAFILGV